VQTTHSVTIGDARKMTGVADRSIDLVVTSPPYPMIQMWDNLFGHLDPAVTAALKQHRGMTAFELMHRVLDPVWLEVHRALKSGGIACINIGDAVRSVGNDFSLYPNHIRVLSYMLSIGFQALPMILWRKPTNAPTKFMGSGMMPPGAYVTLEHEHILILRKGAKRSFTLDNVQKRRQSSYFWEERNDWFSDIWLDLVGIKQHLAEKEVRQRSAAFPFELPFRLINMFSVMEDCVLDPFVGIGTTMAAAMVCGRNCIGYELDPDLCKFPQESINAAVYNGCRRLTDRLERHLDFVRRKTDAGHEFKHHNRFYGFPVMSRQETDLIIQKPASVLTVAENSLQVQYEFLRYDAEKQLVSSEYSRKNRKRPAQNRLFDD